MGVAIAKETTTEANGPDGIKITCCDDGRIYLDLEDLSMQCSECQRRWDLDEIKAEAHSYQRLIKWLEAIRHA
jgi:hypothetical protein